MRICIDARSLRDVPTSLGRYAADLVSHIAKLDRENEYIVVRRPSRHGPIADQANFREIFSPHDISSPRNILAGAQCHQRLRRRRVPLPVPLSPHRRARSAASSSPCTT